ncbi:MAG: carboxyl transferase domain-containing protein [Xanthomonadales bacterium]|nr:carboxyl transferase domain-containing protein [Xanthomonadales bacterium]
MAQQMGGAERVAKHRAAGKLSVRERVEQFLDPDSFHEVGSVTGKAQYDDKGNITSFTSSYLVMGRGRVNGKPVIVAGDDFTVRGGSSEGGVKDKLLRVEAMARDLRLPLIRLVDGTGGGGSVRTTEVLGYMKCPSLLGWGLAVQNLSTVPVVSLALGSVAGLGAMRVAGSHYSLMIKDTSQIFVAGPPVVKRIGQDYTKNELGGSQIHARNGTVDDEAATEAKAFEMARKFLTYLPPSVYELPERTEPANDASHIVEPLIKAIPKDSRQVYKIRPIINSVVDKDSFFEIGRLWGRSIVTGFARLDGWPVAVMASDPYFYGGAWTVDAARKIRRFVDLAQTFHLPMMHLVDCPGFMIGLEAEQASAVRFGMETITAINESTIPWCGIIMRKCFGIAGGAHVNNARYSMRYAWPSAEWGSLPVQGGLEVAYRSEIESALDPKAKMAEIEERLRLLRSPFRSAEAFNIDEIIDPRETRRILCDFANVSAGARVAGPPSFGYRP